MGNTESENNYFGFISSVINYSGTSPYEIIPGYTLCHASEEQIEKIKKTLNIINIPGRDPNHLLYESKIVIQDEKSFREQPLPREEWNYWVVNMLSHKEALDETLQLAFTVADADLFLGAYFQEIGLYSIHFGKFTTFYENYFYDRYKSVKQLQVLKEEDLQEIKLYYFLLKKLPHEFHHIKTAVEDLERLRWLSDRVSLKHLGYFAVLELVLTHAPKNTDPTDSILRQIRSKLALIENRNQKKLQLSKRFNGAGFKKIINQLYAYRSRIAHGVRPDFTGDLQILKNSDYTHKTIKDITKLVVQQALHEPQLMTDLKNC